MNGNAMRKKLGPVADDIAMFLSGIDGFPHDLWDFSAVGARTWTGVTGFKIPSHLLPHSFDKHINNMLRHNFCDPGFRGFLVVQWMVQPLVETGSTGSHGSGQVPILACGAGGGDILFILFRFFIFRVLNSPLPSAMRAWRIATEVIPVSASIARFDDIVVLVRTFGAWGGFVRFVVLTPIATGAGFLVDGISPVLAGVAGPLPPCRFIWSVILISVAGDAGFLFDRFPLIFTCQTGLPCHLGFSPLCFFPRHHLHLYQFVGIGGEAGKSGSESTLPARGLHYRDIAEFAVGAPPCILACRGVRRLRGFRGFKVAKVHVTGCTGFRGLFQIFVLADKTI